jgi:DNA-binding MarR family transcriptional regulator
MPTRLAQEIRKKRGFASAEQEAFLNILKTADVLAGQLADLLKPAALSATQYNVLRILRGAGGEGLSCGEVAERMITRDPDITRLMDRLEKRGLISRHRHSEDRRVVKSRISDEGLKVLASLDQAVLDLHSRQLGHLGALKLKRLIDLLEKARSSEN